MQGARELRDATSEAFDARGYAVAPRVISYETAEACRVDAIAALNAALSASMHEAEAHLRELGDLRYEVRVGLTPATASAIREFLHSPMADLVAVKLGEDAALVSLSAVLSERGANAESAERGADDCASLRIALNRTSAETGATTLWPFSHSASSASGASSASRAASGERIDLEAGDAILLAPGLSRCGGGVSGMRRYSVALVLSFATSAAALASQWPRGSRGSRLLAPELCGRLSLLSLPALLDAGEWAAPASSSAPALREPCGSEYLRRNAAGALAVFSEDGWLFGCHGDTADLGGSSRADPASSRRAALRRSLDELEALGARLGCAVPACEPPRVPPPSALAAKGPLVDIPQPMAEVLVGLLRQHRPAGGRPLSPRVKVCLAELFEASRATAETTAEAEAEVEAEAEAEASAQRVVAVPLAALRAISVWHIGGPHVQSFLEDVLQSGWYADAGIEAMPPPSPSALRQRWVLAHSAYYRRGHPHGQSVGFRRAQLPPPLASTPARRFAAALDAASHGQLAAVAAWLDSAEGSVDARGGRGPSTLLMQASYAGALPLVELLLLVWHASPDVQDDDGVTALHLAAGRGDVAVIRCLLRGGATIDLCDTIGADAEAWAASRGHEQCAALLAGQRFEPLVLRSLLTAREIARLLSIREAVGARAKTFMDHCESHEVIFLHAADNQGAVQRSSCDRLIARIIRTMRLADPRARLGDDGNGHLTVRCCELHTYRAGGALMADDHRDTGSAITMSVLLSEPSEATGGQFLSWEAGADGASATAVEHPLGRGDAILFRSEDFHNVSQVHSGVRQSLVVELWTGEANSHDRNG